MSKEEMIEKVSKAAKRLWKEMTPEERALRQQQISAGMKSHWKTLTAKQRSDIAKKAAATRRTNARFKGKEVPDEKS